jgi:Fe-S cluster biogenesis protein NfuA
VPDATSSPDARSVGQRIERLLDATASDGPMARERAEDLVRVVAELYGSGLERMLEIAYDAGALDDAVLDALAGDELVSSLLVVHGLHPYSVEQRVANALERVRPCMGSHGGDIQLVEVTDEGVARLRMLGSCDGCASSAVTLDLTVREAVEAAAPEVVRIDVVEEERPAGPAALIPVETLTARLRDGVAGDPMNDVAAGAVPV